MQKSVVRVLESRQAKTRRVAQSRTAKKYKKPRSIGMYDMSATKRDSGVRWYAAKKVREDRMFGIALGRLLLAIERLNPHQCHQPRDVPAADAIALR